MYTNVLVAVDLEHGEIADHLLRLARHLAGEKGKVTLLNILQPVPSYIGIQVPGDVVEKHSQAAAARLEEMAARAAKVDATAIGHGHPAKEILDEASRIGADAIVVGSHKPGLGDYLLGSPAARVVRHAPCTVIVDRSAVTASGR